MKLERLKFRSSSDEESIEIYNYLVKLGYDDRQDVCYYKSRRNFWAEADGRICFNMYSPDTLEAFESDLTYSECKFTKTTFYSHCIVEPKRNVVIVGDVSYYEDELKVALENIKPIAR